MRRVALALLVLGATLAGLVAAAPAFAPGVARSRGVSMESAAWSAGGLVLRDVVVGGATADRGTLGWDRVLRLESVTVSGGADGARAEDQAGVGRAPPSWLAGVEVAELTLEGTPLPPLSGTVYPERDLQGEGAWVRGDDAELLVPTEYGEVTVRVRPDGSGHALEASCTCTFQPEGLGGVVGPLELRARGVLDGERRFVGEVRADGVSAQVNAKIGGSSRVIGTFTLPPTEVSAVYDLLAGVVPEARRAQIQGELSGEGRFVLQPMSVHFEPQLSGFSVDGLVGDTYLAGSFTYMGHDRTGAYVPVRGGEGTENWVPLGELGTMLPMAVVAAEDAGFYQHPGYDLAGMVAAAGDNAKAGTVVRGGSTLTQQLAKNLFLTGDRTYARKLRELLYAVEMERELGKRRILELYLNIVEWGPEVRGGRAGSRTYFLKEPHGLLPEEAAFMASILRNPRGGRAKQYTGGRVNARRLSKIIDNMVQLDPAVRAEALGRDVNFVPPAN